MAQGVWRGPNRTEQVARRRERHLPMATMWQWQWRRARHWDVIADIPVQGKNP